MAPPRPNYWRWCFQPKKKQFTIFLNILNLKGHQNGITGSRVTAILLNSWIFPIRQSGEASRWGVCYQPGLLRLVVNQFQILLTLLYDQITKTPTVHSFEPICEVIV